MINRKLVLVVIAFACIVFIIFVLQGLRGESVTKSKGAALKVWGVFETTDNMQEMAKEYRKVKSKAKIEYRNFEASEYEDLLIGEIAEGDGPDIAFIHNTWLPRHYGKFVPLSEDPASIELVKATFVQTVLDDLIHEGKVYALPLYVDSLGLYYNTDHYQDSIVRGRPAGTWQELQNDLLELNVRDASATHYARSGLAMGTSGNIGRSSDIIYLLLLQGGGVVYSEDMDKIDLGATNKDNVLGFYTSFADSSKSYASWNDSFDYYTDVFASGKVSTIIGFSYLLPEVRSKADAKKTVFDTAPIPQRDTDNPVNLASYWAMAVNRNSKNIAAASEFIQYLTITREVAERYYDLTGKPPSRRDLIEEHQHDQYIGPFARGAISAKTFPVFDNDRYDHGIERAIEEVVTGKANVRNALQSVEDQINKFLAAESTLRK